MIRTVRCEEGGLDSEREMDFADRMGGGQCGH